MYVSEKMQEIQYEINESEMNACIFKGEGSNAKNKNYI